MAQNNTNIPTINLKGIGAGEVRVDEITNTTRTIINEFRKLNGKEPLEVEQDSSDTTISQTDVNWAKMRKYGLYTIGGVTAVYLIGKALE
ncbi:hypothetical protein LX73_2329 [Fodinibius salinus]|uniref:Uncharacterized protein n=1 Tax=Fodinibius salinus TaxID=860790 RepID=A0A5D3YK27_9BACT|nr:hypothetical protein [Fodinibius salinus]TYP92082.1 hypothetical protein LX73_2329 [Fodinibius salinus]